MKLDSILVRKKGYVIFFGQLGNLNMNCVLDDFRTITNFKGLLNVLGLCRRMFSFLGICKLERNDVCNEFQMVEPKKKVCVCIYVERERESTTAKCW